jgi:hypothetical protein
MKTYSTLSGLSSTKSGNHFLGDVVDLTDQTFTASKP